MTPILINNNQYYFCVVGGGYDTSPYTVFYKLVERNVVIKTRKYWIFGPVLKTETKIKKDYIKCFEYGSNIINNLDEKAIKLIKEKEEVYSKKDIISSGKMAI